MSATPHWILRIDDRLVHGQVCVGWCDALGIPRLVLADDAIAASDFERELYACCPAAGQVLEFLGLAELATALRQPPPATTLVVLPGTAEALRLAELGAPLAEITVGGLHDQPGARQLTDYLFLTPAQEADLRALLTRGIRLVGQPLPSSPRLDVGRLLAG
jgi:mannose/fructose/N-acetylgalactosamine-specific phosphotransferase system component IIB